MSIPSRFADIEIPDAHLSAFVLERCAELGDKPAIIDGPSRRVLTFADLERQARRLAGGLAELGVGRGDVVALLAPNGPDYPVVFHGTLIAGGIITTINPMYNTQEIAHQLNDSGAKVLIADSSAIVQARAAAEAAGHITVLVIGDQSYRALSQAEPLTVPLSAPADLVAAMPYSSGTTGRAKGVLLSHRNLVANLLQMEPVSKLAGHDVVIGVLPFFHIYGMTVILNYGLRTGATVVTMPRFDLEGFLRSVEQHRVTRAFVVPPIVLALTKQPIVDRFDLSSLDVVMSGAAPLGEELENACRERLSCQVIQGYGMTEASPVTHCVPTGATPRPGTIGPALPNVECRIVDDLTGVDAAPGERGELWVRGPNVMLGYHDNPEATAATLDEDGWLHTGDVAVVDDDGFFSIVDRIKELIKYKGFQVPPAELEALLATHPAVADVAVVGVPDEEAGEVPKAYVVVQDEVSAEELRGFVADRVASYKQIRSVEFIDEIPKSASGKILRRLLKEQRGATPQ